MRLGIHKISLVVGWFAISAAVSYFFLRDVPGYTVFTPESYGVYWNTRFYLAAHVAGAGIGILAGLLQVLNPIRRRWPALHRWLGRFYVIGCCVGAPAALGLAATSECITCRPALGSLAIYWLVTTLLAFHFVRRRLIASHRSFMIRSFVAMNVFVLIRIGYLLAGPEINRQMNLRTMVEFVACFIPLILVEAWLNWSPELRRAIAANRRSPVAG